MLNWLKSRFAETTSKSAITGASVLTALYFDGTIADWHKIVVPLVACGLAFVYREPVSDALVDITAVRAAIRQPLETTVARAVQGASLPLFAAPAVQPAPAQAAT